jgi:hypothetical protein
MASIASRIGDLRRVFGLMASPIPSRRTVYSGTLLSRTRLPPLAFAHYTPHQDAAVAGGRTHISRSVRLAVVSSPDLLSVRRLSDQPVIDTV